MIKLKVNSRKELSINKTTKVFKGENLMNSFQVTANNPYIGDKRVSDCDFFLHVVMCDGRYIVYPVEWSENSIPLTGFVPITADITSTAQIVNLFVEIKSGNTVIGKTNSVPLQIYDAPDEQTAVTPREELEQTIEELETELESATELTEALEALKAGYNSVPERIAADETQIRGNTQNITASQSAIVSLTAALNGKLDDAPSSVKTSNITDSAVTTSKIADSSVSYQKLSTSLQTIVDRVPEIPVYAVYEGTLSAADALDSGDYCTLGAVHQFTIAGLLAAAVGIGAAKPCEFRYINGYQIITQTDTQQIYARQITRVAPTFQAESWAEVLSPAITSLQNTVGTLNTQLENALNGGA